MVKKINIESSSFSCEIINELMLLQENNVILLSKKLLQEYHTINSNLDILYIAKDNEKIIGFMIAKNLIDTIDIEYILIDKNYTKKGIASSMLEQLFNYAKQEGIFNIMLEVRVSNISAISLYTKNGFKVINKREKYYKDNLEDALIMQKIIKQS